MLAYCTIMCILFTFFLYFSFLVYWFTSELFVYVWSSSLAPLFAPSLTLKQRRRFESLYCSSSLYDVIVMMSLSCFIVICLCKRSVTMVLPRIDASTEEWCRWPLQHSTLLVVHRRIDTNDLNVCPITLLLKPLWRCKCFYSGIIIMTHYIECTEYLYTFHYDFLNNSPHNQWLLCM
jgi:hypothetical protein